MAIKRPKVFVANPQMVSAVDVAELEPPIEDYRDTFPVMGSVDLPEFAETYETVTLSIPRAVYEEYEKVAGFSELSVEELMQARLVRCKTHNALRGIWFSDSERAQLENILQKWPLESASQTLKLLIKAGTLRIDEEEIVLTPAQKRVLSLAMYGGRTPKTFFEAMLKKELRTA